MRPGPVTSFISSAYVTANSREGWVISASTSMPAGASSWRMCAVAASMSRVA